MARYGSNGTSVASGDEADTLLSPWRQGTCRSNQTEVEHIHSYNSQCTSPLSVQKQNRLYEVITKIILPEHTTIGTEMLKKYL